MMPPNMLRAVDAAIALLSGFSPSGRGTTDAERSAVVSDLIAFLGGFNTYVGTY